MFESACLRPYALKLCVLLLISSIAAWAGTGTNNATKIVDLDCSIRYCTLVWLSNTEVIIYEAGPWIHPSDTLVNLTTKQRADLNKLPLSDILRVKDAMSNAVEAGYKRNEAAMALSGRHLSLPSSTTFDSCIPSPKGDMIAWLLKYSYPDTVLGSKDGRFGHGSGHRQAMELWISSNTGTHFHRLRQITTDTDQFDETEIQWLPDGKQISFVAGQTLWTLPVE